MPAYAGRHCAPRPAREGRLRNGAATAAVAAVAAAVVGSTAAPAGASVSAYYLDRYTSSYAADFLGYPYSWGGSSPAGFDCSGLTQYVYGHFGYQIPRTADEQFHFFRQIPEAYAWGGDLVFFHAASGYVYHVGIYEGHGNMVSALDYEYGVKRTPVSWGGSYVTYGTITH